MPIGYRLPSLAGLCEMWLVLALTNGAPGRCNGGRGETTGEGVCVASWAPDRHDAWFDGASQAGCQPGRVRVMPSSEPWPVEPRHRLYGAYLAGPSQTTCSNGVWLYCVSLTWCPHIGSPCTSGGVTGGGFV